jgi:hypothetical protein
MRPPSVYANRSCPAGCACDVARVLSGPHRVGARLVMILLSSQGWPPSAIAELLGGHPATVRRWIHRYNQHGVAGLADQPRSGRPAWEAPGWVSGSLGCWPTPRGGQLAGSTGGWAGPP